MKKAILALVLLLAAASAASASESLVRRGAGTRTKPILGAIYELTLSVPETLKSADAKALIEADRPMEFVLEIQSRLITRARFVEVTTEGFEKAAHSRRRPHRRTQAGRRRARRHCPQSDCLKPRP